LDKTSLSHTIENLSGNKKNEVRVRFYNSDINWTEWSAPQTYIEELNLKTLQATLHTSTKNNRIFAGQISNTPTGEFVLISMQMVEHLNTLLTTTEHTLI
jgi:hypothetical protein